MRTVLLKLLTVVAMACFAAAPASARRTVIDSNGQLTLSGYCDNNGDDCTPVSLGYSVDFGGGRLTSVLIYGNGILTFGPQVAVFNDFMGQLSNYGVPVVTPGFNPDIGEDSFMTPDLFFQSGKLTFGAGGVLTARWYYCQGPENCVDNYILTLTPGTGGYAAAISYPTQPVIKISGYHVPGAGGEQFFTALPTSFFIPAIFGTVPEPATWIMLLVGFGLTGSIVRRRNGTLRAA